jgi:FimV-like protein
MTTDVKLELASAYIYLGDFDSARELLEAVQGEGTDTQSERARNALTALPLALI